MDGHQTDYKLSLHNSKAMNINYVHEQCIFLN